jgi:AraC-like DNA-binding protein
MRVFGSYALVYVVAGSGSYRDARRAQQNIAAGDCILVLPELAHQYGAPRGARWDEYHIIFEGPLFDLWREAGWLDASRRVFRLEPLELWLPRFQSFADAPRATTQPAIAREVTALQDLLADIFETAPRDEAAPPHWLQRACRELELNLEKPYDGRAAASAAGLSYQAFRKSFARETGVSPSRYRAVRVMEAARALMQHGNLTNAEIAARLGFADEGHFSKRFKGVTGQTPRAFRQSLRAPRENNVPQG